MAIKKKPLLNKTAGRQAEAEAETEDEDESESSAAKPGAKVKAGEKAEAAANEELVALFEQYDEATRKTESYFIELVEFIQDKQLDRATVVASMMKARGIDYGTANTQYSRMKKLLNNEEVLEELKSGQITMKIAREKTKKTQENPKSAKPEAKEQRFTNTLKAFVAAAKESGFSRKEIMLSVEASLKDAGIR